MFGMLGVSSTKIENPIIREGHQRVTSIDFDGYPYDWAAQFGLATKL
ncbi:MAG: hypothetical protein ACI9U0_001172 [Flavobacteriales bacterium]|jgi:hypothetical protein|tara:strand:+ start:5881 stop:6021 length:141 start_codon:yes stop_codon:yes gene_type:complete